MGVRAGVGEHCVGALCSKSSPFMPCGRVESGTECAGRAAVRTGWTGARGKRRAAEGEGGEGGRGSERARGCCLGRRGRSAGEGGRAGRLL